MFQNYTDAKNRRAPKWALPLLMACFTMVMMFFFGGWMYSMWEIKKLDMDKNSFDLAAAPPPPPPPPPPPGGKKPQTTEIKPKKIKVKDLVQPVKIEKQEAQPKEESSGDPAGEEGGEEGGEAGGVVGGTIGGVVSAAPPPPPPPPPPLPPQIVPPNALNALRVSGDAQISPNDVTATEISRSGQSKLVATYKFCLDTSGGIKSVTMLKSTGFPAYDAKIKSDMQSQWKYRPFLVNGTPAPVCSTVTFIYKVS